MKIRISILASVLALAACADNASDGVLPTYQKEAMDRASEVEGQLERAEEERRQQMEDY